MNVAVLIPTRSRPLDFITAYQSVIDTSFALVVAYVDDDQESAYRDALASAEVPYLLGRYNKPGIPKANYEPREGTPRLVVIVGKRIGPLAAVNRMAWLLTAPEGNLISTLRIPPVRALAYMTDDSTVGPPGWDRWLISATDSFPDRLGVISGSYADDDTTVFNFPSMSVEMHDALGWFGPPQMHAWYWDTALELIADVIGVRYAKRDELRFNHIQQPNHPSHILTTDDAVAFHHWCLTERKTAITRLRKAVALVRSAT